MDDRCGQCGTAVASGEKLCANCRQQAAVAPGPAAPAEKSGKSVGCLLLSGAGCLLLVLAAMVVAAVVYFGWDRIRARFPEMQTLTAAIIPPAVNLNDYADTWVVEEEAADPDSEDMVVFRVENGKLVGVCPDPRRNYRMELAPVANNRLRGAATGDGINDTVEIELSADTTRLTVIIKPGTPAADTAVLLRFVPRPVAVAPAPAPAPARPAAVTPRRPAPAAPVRPAPVPQKPDSPRRPPGQKPPPSVIDDIIADIERDAVRLPD